MHASLSQVSFSMCHGIDNHVDMSDYVIPLVFVLLLSNNQSANEMCVCVCVCVCVCMVCCLFVCALCFPLNFVFRPYDSAVRVRKCAVARTVTEGCYLNIK